MFIRVRIITIGLNKGKVIDLICVHFPAPSIAAASKILVSMLLILARYITLP